MSKYTDYVERLTKAGFEKVTIVNPSYQTIGASAQDAVASGWPDSQGVMINENQEIADKWAEKKIFYFFKHKFNVIQKSEKHIVGSKGKDVIVAKKYGDCTVVAYGRTKGMGPAKKGKGAAVGKFPNAAGAYNDACKALFDDLDEDED